MSETALERFRSLFGRKKPLIGMVHLAPLPGAPRFSGRLEEVIERAVADADALCRGPVDGLMIENFNDAPFYPDAVEPETVAAITRVAAEVVRRASDRPIGINILRNAWKASLAVAYVVGASFVRMNVFTDPLVTDQGILAGAAHLAVRYRRALGAERVLIFADLYAKHGAPLAPRPLAVVARDMASRGLADAVIVSGDETGTPPREAEIRVVKDAVPGCPVVVGSGVAEDTMDLLRHADGAICGSGLKKDGIVTAPVDPERVRRLVAAFRTIER